MINLLVALMAEARPLIHHFHLSGLPSIAGFRCYGNESITLLVTGSGVVSMASGVTALGLMGKTLAADTGRGVVRGSDFSSGSHTWINPGIAGHRSLPVGTLVLASKVTDQASDRSWYPPQIVEISMLQPAVRRLEMETVPTAVETYPRQAVVEMEASGFYPTACRFGSGEQIHLLKVISDNREQPASRLNEADVAQLMATLLSPLEQLMAESERLPVAANQFAPVTQQLTAAAEQFTGRWRFTVSQRRRLQQLLDDGLRLTGELLQPAGFAELRSTKALLAALEDEVDQARLAYRC
ncbi:MAG TPA: hypothetical protein DCF45_07355 [Gammaproteobacteria bacterium]|nr:hypothetical protein [Gammaproteobacteria bacterium]